MDYIYLKFNLSIIKLSLNKKSFNKKLNPLELINKDFAALTKDKAKFLKKLIAQAFGISFVLITIIKKDQLFISCAIEQLKLIF